MKIITILGARPQFIKAAALSRELTLHDSITEIIVHTGQHFDQNMSDIFFEQMGIPRPNYNLNINSLSHGAMTGQMIEGIEKILIDEKPDLVLVYGDTNSTIAGSLAAKKLGIKVGHIEAGLRSFNMAMPEEINRILTDRISDFLFCPTDEAVSNLKKEGFDNIDSIIVKNGDVMNDAALHYSAFSASKSNIIKDNDLTDNCFVLATVHRQENTDNLDNLKNIICGLNELHKSCRVILPLHPRTKKIMDQHGLAFDFDTIEPIGYFDMVELLKHTRLVVTDSGGLQKEAFFFKKHCITLREQTEWVELVENGFSLLAGASSEKIIAAYQTLITRSSDFSINLYGSGKASSIIAETLLKHF